MLFVQKPVSALIPLILLFLSSHQSEALSKAKGHLLPAFVLHLEPANLGAKTDAKNNANQICDFAQAKPLML